MAIRTDVEKGLVDTGQEGEGGMELERVAVTYIYSTMYNRQEVAA